MLSLQYLDSTAVALQACLYEDPTILSFHHGFADMTIFRVDIWKTPKGVYLCLAATTSVRSRSNVPQGAAFIELRCRLRELTITKAYTATADWARQTRSRDPPSSVPDFKHRLSIFHVVFFGPLTRGASILRTRYTREGT